MTYQPPGNRTVLIVAGAVTAVALAACCGLGALAIIRNPDGKGEPTVHGSTAPAAKPSTRGPATTAPETPAAVIVMPNVTGLNAAVADVKLRELGFTNLRYGSRDDEDKVVLLLANWAVVEQSAKPGAKLAADDLIVLTCTKH